MDIPDYASFREAEEKYEYYEPELSLAENLTGLINQALLLPHHDIQLPIIVSYCLIPSALATIAPIMFLLGGRGSGKSTLMKIMGAVHNQPLLSASSSAVALRNHINQSRWADKVNFEGEKNTLLLFDNVGENTLLNETLYLYLLNGYDRETDSVMISGVQGSNQVFKVFGLKVLSSVHSVLNNEKFVELVRRCLVIRFKVLEDIDTDSKFSPLMLEVFNLKTFNEKFNEFWTETSNIQAFLSAKRAYIRNKQKGAIPDIFSTSRWAISLDLLATGYALNLWDGEAGIETVSNYWRWFDEIGKPTESPLIGILKQVVETEMGTIDALNNRYGEGSFSYEISPKVIKNACVSAAIRGALDNEPRPKVIAEAMQTLGWSLKMGEDKKMFWRKDY
ncbi:hypothetical protein BCD67_24685 [Oscillatoriales cyanobacterium USR001]|nr:hypothetical protein BCD67_24685 [Oscillatoriales cyanobacterium USR001]